MFEAMFKDDVEGNPMILLCFADHDRTSSIANTTFAETWRNLVVWNPMISNLMFNGGMLGEPLISISCIMRLALHSDKLMTSARPASIVAKFSVGGV